MQTEMSHEVLDSVLVHVTVAQVPLLQLAAPTLDAVHGSPGAPGVESSSAELQPQSEIRMAIQILRWSSRDMIHL